MQGDITQLTAYMERQLEQVNADKYHASEFEAQWKEQGQTVSLQSLLTDSGILLQSLKEDLQQDNSIAASDIEQNVQSECIDPLVNRTEGVKQEFKERYTTEKSAVADYHTAINQYHPRTDTTGINEDVAQMRSNASQLQQTLTESNKSYMDYANQMYKMTQENITTLQEHIAEAKAESGQKLTEGLSSAQSIKKQTSSENQSAMADFAAKLPYTRIGSMEYTQAYEFITDPVQLMPVSDYQRLKDEVDNTIDKSRTAQSGQTKRTVGYWIERLLLAALGIAVAGLLLSAVRQTRHRKTEQSAE